MKTPAENRPAWQDDRVCQRCGRYGALELGGQWLCPDCVQQASSCCPEFQAEPVDDTTN